VAPVPGSASPEVVLLVAHGSRNPAAAAEHAGLCAAVARLTGVDVRPAFLEIDRPTVAEAVDRAAEGGGRRIRMVPYFLHAGNHVQRDLPALAEDARGRHPAVVVELDEHLGADPDLVELVARRVLDARPAAS
jgi:sirohydrochlorin ferrochelatase